MSSTQTQTQTQTLPHTYRLQLNGGQGPVFREVSTAAPRPATEDEIPIIDLSPLDGDLEARKGLAAKIRAASENTGFFYIKNHGISEDFIQHTLSLAKQFFAQPLSDKEKLARHGDIFAGYIPVGVAQSNRTDQFKGMYI